MDFYVPSLDGKFVAMALSENGSEDSAAHVFEVATGKELPDRVPRVNFATAGGSLDWKADSSGFYYTRYPQANERPPKTSIFISKFIFTSSAPIPAMTAMSSARIFRESPKFSSH